MIKAFKCKETEKIWNGFYSKKFHRDIQNTARRKLRYLNNISDLQELRIPPSNHLEALSGKRKGQHSIRINDQWRICFVWKNGDVFNVEITEYH